jgi:Uma2 family endonuclease
VILRKIRRCSPPATRVRIPDVCLAVDEPADQIIRTPPFICLEVFSPDDRLSEMRQPVEDYLAFGVPYVWILDPATRHAWLCTPGGMQQVTELRTENPETLVPVCDLFE